MNIDSLLNTSDSYQSTDRIAVQSSSNQIAASLQEIKNGPTEKFNFKGLPPEVIMDHVIKHLKPSDIKNLNKSKVYKQIPIYQNYLRDPNYRHIVNEWLTWQKMPPISEDENRKLAVDKMIECLENNGKRLDLSYLHLTSLPNLKPLKSLLTLDYEGNDSQPIYECFTIKPRSDTYNYHELNLSSNLPNSINRINFYVDYDILSNYFYDASFAIVDIKDNNTRNFFKFYSRTKYTNDFEKDFLKSYRL